MSRTKQKHTMRFINFYRTIIALIIGILCSLFVFNIIYKSFEYPEEEYQKLNKLLEQVVDVDHGLLNYNMEIPSNMDLYYSVINNKPSIKVCETLENEIPISIFAYFDTDGNLISIRSFKNEEDLNRHCKIVDIILAFLAGTTCFFGVFFLLTSNKIYETRKLIKEVLYGTR